MTGMHNRIARKALAVALLLGSVAALAACGDGYTRTSVGISSYDYASPRDRDGVPNRFDRDRDGDGVPNRFDWDPNNPYRR
jgi:hypothetical protein